MAVRMTTASELAGRTGMSNSQLSNYLRGKTEPTLGVLDRLAQALGVAPAWLISEKEISHPFSECLKRVNEAALRGAEKKD
jgi:transcriptional regulator with XRE-family HTH domain